jgi:hypothetical protein
LGGRDGSDLENLADCFLTVKKKQERAGYLLMRFYIKTEDWNPHFKRQQKNKFPKSEKSSI